MKKVDPKTLEKFAKEKNIDKKKVENYFLTFFFYKNSIFRLRKKYFKF